MSYKIDLYSDRGKLLESNVYLKSIAPTQNAVIEKIVRDTKSITGNADDIRGNIYPLIRISNNDDTNVKVIGDGKQLLIQIPSKRIYMSLGG